MVRPMTEVAPADLAPPTRRRIVARRLLFALAPPVVLLGAAECVCRLAGVGAPPVELPTDPPGKFVEVVLTAPDGRRSTYREGIVAGARTRLNEAGFRDWLYHVAERGGALRVACVGDSVTFGQGLEEHEPWPRRLAAMLSEDAPDGRPVRVMNFGRRGANTEDERVLFEREVLPYAPDAVVLGFTVFNDAESHAEAQVRVRAVEAHRQRPLYRLAKAVRTRSRLLGWLTRRVRREGSRRALAELIERSYADDAAGWIECRAALRAIAARCREREMPLVVALFPVLWRNDPELNDLVGYPFREQHARVRAAFDGFPGVRVVDVVEGMADLDRQRIWIPGDGHPDARYNRRVAELVAAELLALLDRPPR
jgi:lysophospholipase L1-like esterase